MKNWKNQLSISEQKWVELLKNPKITRDIDKKILTALYESDNYANVCSEIVKMINDPNCPTHGTANLRVSEFGKRILKETGVQALSFRDNGIPWWWNIPFLGWPDEEHRGHYYWQLRPELANAIKNHLDLLQSGEKRPQIVREPNVWIFQNNLKKSNLTIDEHVSTTKGNWSVRQHGKDIKKGDIVLFWISGKNRGIYSVADILDKPDLTEVNPNWPWVLNKSSKKRRPKELMVDYEGLRKIDPLILESELKKIPELSNLSIINRYRKTNYSVTKSEWEILSKEIEKRKIFASPLKLKSETSDSAINQKLIDQKNVARHNQNKKMNLDILKRRAKQSQKDVEKRENTSSDFDRNQDVVDYVKAVAKGICQLCKAPAPFCDKDGDPFLHAHHIIWLTRNGSDTIDNCVALCPNCHAKMHVLDKEDDIAKLIEIAGRQSE